MKSIIVCDDGQVGEVVPFCSAWGTGVEVQAFFDPVYAETVPGAVERHREAIAPFELCALHGVFGDLCPGSFDPLVRALTRTRFKQSLQVAEQLGVQHIIFHHGYVPHTSSYEGWLRRCTAFWKEFLAEFPANFYYHIENLLDLDPELLSDVVSGIGAPNVDINLDIGHAHCYSRRTVMQWIERLGRQIGYVHMHDNHGEDDDHLGFGKGNLPLSDVCDALQEYAPGAIWAVEVRNEWIGMSLEWLADRGYIPKKSV